MERTYSTREVADMVGSQEWRVRRLFESGTLAEPHRFAGKRAIPSSLVPAIVDALRERGWLPEASLPAPIRDAILAVTADEEFNLPDDFAKGPHPAIEDLVLRAASQEIAEMAADLQRLQQNQ